MFLTTHLTLLLLCGVVNIEVDAAVLKTTSCDELASLSTGPSTTAPAASGQHISARAIPIEPTSAAVAQKNAAHTDWKETTLNGVSTWVPMAFTQTFAAVPDQGALPGSGTIGMPAASDGPPNGQVKNKTPDQAGSAPAGKMIAGRAKRAWGLLSECALSVACMTIATRLASSILWP